MMSLNGRNVYLSGPMTGIEDYNIPAFASAHNRINNLDPSSVYDPGQEALRCRSNSHDWWMAKSLHELTRPELCINRILVSLPGWEKSEGATIERAVAKACGIECVDLEEVFSEEVFS